MKLGILTHPKTRRAMKLLGMPTFKVVGILECLTHYAAQYADDGDLSRFDEEDFLVYAGIDPVDTGIFAALHQAGFLDRREDGGYLIHDWKEHAPTFIYDRLRKREQRAGKNPICPTLSQPSPENSVYAKPGRAGPSQAKPSLNTDRPVGETEPTDRPTKVVLDFTQIDISEAKRDAGHILTRTGLKTRDDPKNKRLVFTLAALKQDVDRFYTPVEEAIAALRENKKASNPWGYLKACAKRSLDAVGLDLNRTLDQAKKIFENAKPKSEEGQ